MMTDTIADMLTRIRNAQAAGKRDVIIPFSKLKFRIAEILRDEKFVESVEKIEDRFGSIKIRLKYENGKSRIDEIKRISSPGLRRYVTTDEIPVVKNGYGIAILSTSRGVVTGKEAKKLKVGGEVICYVA